MVWIRNWDATLLLAALVNRPLEVSILKWWTGRDEHRRNELPLDRPVLHGCHAGFKFSGPTIRYPVPSKSLR
jgi:hypothetical protein